MKEILYAIIPYYNFFQNQERFNSLLRTINEHSKLSNLKIIIAEGYVDEKNILPDFSNVVYKHIRYKYEQKIWIKENLINLIIENELPLEWNYICWLDADILFLQKNWVEKTIEKLKIYDIIQMFDFALMLKPRIKKINNLKTSVLDFHIGYTKSILSTDLPFEDLKIESKNPKIGAKGHCGFAWATTKNFYFKIKKIWDLNLIGGADAIIAKCSSQLFSEKEIKTQDKLAIIYSNKYGEILFEYYKKFEQCKLGFLNQPILVAWHGDWNIKKYTERHEILKKYYFNKSFTNYDNGKIYIKDKNIVEDIENYMKSREILN